LASGSLLYLRGAARSRNHCDYMKQSSRHFGGNKKVAPVGRGASTAPSGSGSVAAAAAPFGAKVAKRIPPGRSAVAKGGAGRPAKAKQGTNMTASKGGKLPC
jgi:hypothetical protein